MTDDERRLTTYTTSRDALRHLDSKAVDAQAHSDGATENDAQRAEREYENDGEEEHSSGVHSSTI
jgi:hypothetical protein